MATWYVHLQDNNEENYRDVSNAVPMRRSFFHDVVDLITAKSILRKPQYTVDDDPYDDTIDWDGSVSSLASSTKLSACAESRRVSAGSESRKISVDSNNVYPRVENLIDENGKIEKIPPKDVVKRIILGKVVLLELYKSKDEKLSILDEAIKYRDGNAILVAVLFLKATVKLSIFNDEIITRPIAVRQYISHLRQLNSWTELIDFYSTIQCNANAAFLRLKQAITIPDSNSKIISLRDLYQTHFACDDSLTDDGFLIQEQINLLEVQDSVEQGDIIAEKEGREIFKTIPRESIIGKPVMSTLHYNCLYHFDENEIICSNPKYLQRKHNITEKQYLWVALNAKAQLNLWNDVNELFKSKNSSDTSKLQSAIGFDTVVIVLHKYGAPRTELNKYCHLIEDTQTKLNIGKKFGCSECVIETYKLLRDKTSLEDYSNSLQANSQEYFYAEDVLKQNVKWKRKSRV